MSAVALPLTSRRRPWLPTPGRHRGLLVACAVFVALFVLADAITPGPFSYFELSFMSSGGATLALAAMGQTIVVLTGGFDLSAGAVVSLVNVVLGTWMGPEPSSQILFGLVALGIGGWSGWSTASSWPSSGCSRSSSPCRPCSSSRASPC
jgi:ribose transport system permease protein